MKNLWAILGLSMLAAACSGNPESPPVVPDTITEVFGGSLDVQGEASFSFTVGSGGSVSATLASVVLARPGPTTTVALALALGTPVDGVCSAANPVTTSAGLAAQLSTTFDAGLHCVSVRDVGNLTAPVEFTIRVVHS